MMEQVFSMITFRDIVDIVLVALIAYYAYRLLRRSGAVNLFWGLFAFVAVWFLTGYVFHLELTSALFNQIVSVGAIAIIVIFQNEIRSFFYSLGSRMGKGFNFVKIRQQQNMERLVKELQIALQHMSEGHTGALIVITHKQDLSEYADSGEAIDAMVSARMIENIFFKNSPLHDGALFISNGRLRSAACILPVSQSKGLPSHCGLRHRAALGLAERTDAVALVVSEQTGTISLAQGGQLREVAMKDLNTTLMGLFVA